MRYPASEMQKLALKERVELSRFVVEITGGRVPVIASGHISSDIDAQLQELSAIADTGVDAVVLVQTDWMNIPVDMKSSNKS